MEEEKKTKKRATATKRKTVKKEEKVGTVEKAGVQPEAKYYGTGRRKTAVARVWVKPGSGKMLINGRKLEQYSCGRVFLSVLAQKPLIITNTLGKYDISANVSGGGIPGQIHAVSHGLARALASINSDFKHTLRKSDLLTRDPRMKERKKYGHKRARKSFQYSKR